MFNTSDDFNVCLVHSACDINNNINCHANCGIHHGQKRAAQVS